MRFIYAILILLALAAILLLSETALAQRTVGERTLLLRIKNMEETLDWMKTIACSEFGEYCPEEPEVIGIPVTTQLLGYFMVSRYYTPVEGQERYYHGSYEDDFKINCHGDCFKTASGFDLRDARAFSVAACPPELKLGTRLDIEGIGVVTCLDRGGKIKGERIDVWSGWGDNGLNNILSIKNGGLKSVSILP